MSRLDKKKSEAFNAAVRAFAVMNYLLLAPGVSFEGVNDYCVDLMVNGKTESENGKLFHRLLRREERQFGLKPGWDG